MRFEDSQYKLRFLICLSVCIFLARVFPILALGFNPHSLLLPYRTAALRCIYVVGKMYLMVNKSTVRPFFSAYRFFS